MKKFFLVLMVCGVFVAGSNLVSAQPQDIKTTTYDVSVHCKSCKAKIERDVAFEKGVKEIEASIENKTVTVKYDATKTDSDKIAAAIKKLGYEVKVHNDKAVAAPCGHKHEGCAKQCENEKGGKGKNAESKVKKEQEKVQKDDPKTQNVKMKK